MPPVKRARKGAAKVEYTLNDLIRRYDALERAEASPEFTSKLVLLKDWLNKLKSFHYDYQLYSYSEGKGYRCVGLSFTPPTGDDGVVHRPVRMKGFCVWENKALVALDWAVTLMKAKVPGAFPGDLAILHVAMESPSLERGLFISGSKSWAVVAAAETFLTIRRQARAGGAVSSAALTNLHVFYAEDDAAAMSSSESEDAEDAHDVDASAAAKPKKNVLGEVGYEMSVTCHHCHRLPLLPLSNCTKCLMIAEACMSCGAPCVGCATVSVAGPSPVVSPPKTDRKALCP